MHLALDLVLTKFNLLPTRTPAVVLIGPPGVGKTTVGGALAERLRCQFIDTDQVIQSATGLTIPSIMKEHGEAVFRSLETRLVVELTAKRTIATSVNRKEAEVGTVIATGAGLPITPGNLAKLENLGTVVCLTASIKALAERIALSEERPLLGQLVRSEDGKALAHQQIAMTIKRLETLLEARMPIYAQAQAQVCAENSSVDEMVECILQILSNYD